MSMNLHFKVIGSGAWVDFPFQTPTKLTFDVHNATTLEERLELLHDYIFNVVRCEQHEKEYMWDKVEKKMRDNKLELEWI